MSMSDVELDALVRAVMQKIGAEMPGITQGQCTVVGATDDTAAQGSPVLVQMDGDAAIGAPPVEVQSLVGTPHPGDRGIVLFVPPRGALLVGIIRGIAPECNYWVAYPADPVTIPSGGSTKVPVDTMEVQCDAGTSGDVTLESGGFRINTAADYEIVAGLGWNAVVHNHDIGLSVVRIDGATGGSTPIMDDSRPAALLIDVRQAVAPRIVALAPNDFISIAATHTYGGDALVTGDDSAFSGRTYLQLTKKCRCGDPLTISGEG